MKPHQERVIEEKSQLEEKITKLTAFIDTSNATYASLPVDEKERLSEQLQVMRRYSEILASRIQNFK